MKKEQTINIVAGVRLATLPDLLYTNEEPQENKTILVEYADGHMRTYRIEDTSIYDVWEMVKIYTYRIGYVICGSLEIPDFEVALTLRPCREEDFHVCKKPDSLVNRYPGMLPYHYNTGLTCYLDYGNTVIGPYQLTEDPKLLKRLEAYYRRGLLYTPINQQIIKKHRAIAAS